MAVVILSYNFELTALEQGELFDQAKHDEAVAKVRDCLEELDGLTVEYLGRWSMRVAYDPDQLDEQTVIERVSVTLNYAAENENDFFPLAAGRPIVIKMGPADQL